MRRAVVSLCVLLALDCAFAGEKPESGPLPAWVTSISAPPSDNASSDAPVKLLLSDWQANFSTGSVDAYFHSVMLVQTSQGLAAAGTISLPWNPATDSLIVHHVLILRGTQTIDVLENGPGFTVLRRENSLEYATLNGVLTAVIQPPGLQVGDRIDIAFTLRRVTPSMTADPEFVFTGWPSIPIGLMSFRARWTAPTVMRWWATDVMPKVREARRGDTTEVSFEVRNPAVVVLPSGAPARFRLGRQLEFSSFSSWQKISAQFAPMYAQAAKLGPQSPLRAEANRIRTAHPDRAGQALAALALVQDQVRYVFLGMNEGALVPADADLTWSRRFGDCKGKTALLLALLSELGIEAEPVAVSVAAGDAVDQGLPMIEAFDHVLVRVRLDGQTYWLDGARSGDRQLEDLGAPPYQWGLPFVPGGTGLVQIVAAPLTQPLEEDLVSIDASRGIPGPAAMHTELVFRGQSGALMRFALGSVSVEERDRMLTTIFAKSYPTASIDKIAAHFDEQTAQERVIVDGSLPLEWSGEHLKLEGLRLRYQGDFERTAGPHRDAPYSVPFPLYSRIRETIKLPHSEQPFTVEGEDIHRTVAGIEFVREAHVERDSLTAMASARSMDTEIPFSSATIAQKVLPEVTGTDVYLHHGSDAAGPQPEPSKPAASESPTEPAPANAAAAPPAAAATAQDLINRGAQLLHQRQYDQAIEQLDAALRLEPHAAWAFAHRGMARVWKNEPELAAKDFDAAVALDPGNAAAWSGRGVLALRAGKADEAVGDFTKALKAQPGDGFSLKWRAAAYQRLGDLDKALADSAAEVRAYPGDYDEHVFRARVLRQLGRSADAAEEAEALVAASETDYLAYVAAAEIYLASGKNAQAMQSLDDSLSLKATARAFLTRAAYRPRSDLAGRRLDIEAALKLEPKSAAALSALAGVQSDAGEFDQAEGTLTQEIATFGEQPWLLASRAILYTKASRHDLAEKDLAAARAKSTRAQELNNLCWSLATAKVALDAALDACRQAVAQEPASTAYQDSLGFVLLRLGRYDESIAAYDTALKEYTEHVMSLYGRGMARRLHGDVAGGDEDIKAALRLDAHVGSVFADYGIKP